MYKLYYRSTVWQAHKLYLNAKALEMIRLSYVHRIIYVEYTLAPICMHTSKRCNVTIMQNL